MKEGKTKKTIKINIKIPPHIFQYILNNSRKRKVNDSFNCYYCKVYNLETLSGKDFGDVEGNRQAKLKKYCNCGLTQVDSDRWRNALQITNRVAINQFLKLNIILQHLKVVANLIVKLKISPGIALQFVSNIKKILQEGKEI